MVTRGTTTTTPALIVRSARCHEPIRVEEKEELRPATAEQEEDVENGKADDDDEAHDDEPPHGEDEAAANEDGRFTKFQVEMRT